jgi:hypothetical protein
MREVTRLVYQKLKCRLLASVVIFLSVCRSADVLAQA